MSSKYEETITEVIVIDLLDPNGYLNEYLEGAVFGHNHKSDNYVFAFKIKGRSLVAEPGTGQSMRRFYMYADGYNTAVALNTKYQYMDGKLIDRPGLYTNQQQLELNKVGSTGYNFVLTTVHREYVNSQIERYGLFPIQLARYSDQKTFFLTSISSGGTKEEDWGK